MMKTKTPICSFIEKYSKENNVRLHMPGHKGIGNGNEKFDITEIDGADSLYEANGIIRESEEIAGRIFGAKTFYSTEGSSHVIRAMLYLAVLYSESQGKKPLIAATRNAHKAFISAIALLDINVSWINLPTPSYLSCTPSSDDIENFLDTADEKPTAVYVTSPDYLGNVCNIKSIAEVCHKRNVLLIVDNAHGAYLKFLKNSIHPIDMGADMSCDSAHKTLPALTGAAYLHISNNASPVFASNAKQALSLFGSTSPPYPILASLDALNAYLSAEYRQRLDCFIGKLDKTKAVLSKHGYVFTGNEPMKITIRAKSYGYSGNDMAHYLYSNEIVPEFYDPDFLVLMPTPEISDDQLAKLTSVLLALPKKNEINVLPPKFTMPKAIISPRKAILSDSEEIPTAECVGRILAAITVGCPPAVPIAVSGELIDENTANCFLYYGIEKCSVIK